MPATRAPRSVNGNGSGQKIFCEKLTNPIVNQNIHETDENEF